MFQPFPSLTRFSQDWTVTEKIDGSNGHILIADLADPDINHAYAVERIGDTLVFAGSRKRFLSCDKQGDHMGFAAWVKANAEALIDTLGYGRHYGEWWGQGIQRGYGLKEKRFSLFNVNRWKQSDVEHINGLHVVPVLGDISQYYDCPGSMFKTFMERLKTDGSYAAPGFMDPEGIVMYHGRSRTMFKKTFDYDEQGKWAENQERKENANSEEPK